MKIHRKAAAAGVAVAASVGAAAVYAAWNSTVDGTGAARSTAADSGDGDMAAVALDAANDLYPGAVKTTKVTIDNDNDYPIEVLRIRAGSSRAVGSCAADSVRTDALGTGSAAVAQTAAAGTVIAPGGTGEYELVLRMTNDAADACKSQTFVIGDRTAPADDLVADVRSAAVTSGNTW